MYGMTNKGEVAQRIGPETDQRRSLGLICFDAGAEAPDMSADELKHLLNGKSIYRSYIGLRRKKASEQLSAV
jgi:hypothetical protein